MHPGNGCSKKRSKLLGKGAFRFSKQDRLLKRKDFLALSKSDRKIHSQGFVVLLRSNHLNRMRIGITVSRKVGKAVERNRIKRIVREYFRHHRHRIATSLDANFIARKAAGCWPKERLLVSLDSIFKSLQNE